MKILSRNFTTAEKVLLVVLALILVGLAYYYFVDTPVRKSITASQSEAEMLQTELDGVQGRLSYLTGIQKNLDALGDIENLTWMGSYNNSKPEVKFLNDVLKDTKNYSISFANVTRNGDQIRRNFSLQFQTSDYEEAQEIMTMLMQGENRCLVGDMKCSIKDGTVTINATATFYETMVDGEADSGLPADSAKANK